MEPDLKGITKMLRMVDNFNEPPSPVSCEEINNKKVNNILVTISKLDPTSAVFTPKSYINKVSLNEDKIDLNINKISYKEQYNACDATESKEATSSSENAKNYCRIPTNHKQVENYTPIQLEDMKEKLKIKIGSLSNTKCIKEKRERSMAIMSLLKLNCRPATEENNPKVRAPEYFEKSLSDHAKMAEAKCVNETYDIKVNTQLLFGVNVKEDNLLDIESVPLANLDSRVVSVSKNVHAQLDMLSEQPVKYIKKKTSTENNQLKQESSSLEITKEFKKSIEKVENWLYRPKIKKPTGAIPYLGPVMFKKKVVSTPVSPISIVSENSKTKSKSNYAPSVFADQLTKKYMEQNKEREIIKRDIFTELVEKLKAKDEFIKKQRFSNDTSESVDIRNEN